MAKPFLSVVIPAYNEENRLPLTLVDIDKRLAARDFSYEIVIVVAKSTDRTLEIANKFAETLKNIRILPLENSVGKGDAVMRGMLEARGTYRLFTDADNSVTVDHFDAMLPLFKEGASVVICSRAHKDSKLSPPQPAHKQLFGKIGNLIIQALVLPGIWDSQCGFKAFTEDAAKRIFEKITIYKWGFDVEALALAKRMGFRIAEIPVVWVNDPNTKVKGLDYVKTLLEVVKIRFNLWFGKYNIKEQGTINKEQ